MLEKIKFRLDLINTMLVPALRNIALETRFDYLHEEYVAVLYVKTLFGCKRVKITQSKLRQELWYLQEDLERLESENNDLAKQKENWAPQKGKIPVKAG